MSSKANSNTNKTAHVMNLLRKNNTTASDESVQTELPATNTPVMDTPPADTPAPETSASRTPPIITALNADAEISSQIRDALSDALAEEEKAAVEEMTHVEKTVSSQPMSVSELEIHGRSEMPAESETFTAENESVELEPNHDETSVEEDTSEVPADETPTDEVTTDIPDASKSDISDEPILVNIMELLTREKAGKYMQMLGVCPCSRCLNDVIAIVLNTLPSKYVVLRPSQINVYTDMYSSRFHCDITAQLLQACEKVKKNPRH